MTYKELKQKAKEKNLNITKEVCQYTNKSLFVLYAGSWDTGIFTLLISTTKKSIIDKLNSINTEA